MQNIKKAFWILLKNPFVVLLFALFLLAFIGIMKPVFAHADNNLFLFFVLLLALFSVAFISGWFGMIKTIVLYKETGNIEEDMQNQYSSFKNDFLKSVMNYTLPLAFYVLLFCTFTWFLFVWADNLFGHPSEIMEQIAPLLDGEQQTLFNIMNALPKETLYAILKRSFFIDFGYILYFLLTFYSVPSLYFNESKNPLVALKNGVLAVFKKPLLSFGFLFFIILVNILLKCAVSMFEAIFTSIFGLFVYIVMSVYFAVFIVVLIFTVYEKHFTDNCNNGADSVGEDKACD